VTWALVKRSLVIDAARSDILLHRVGSEDPCATSVAYCNKLPLSATRSYTLRFMLHSSISVTSR